MANGSVASGGNPRVQLNWSSSQNGENSSQLNVAVYSVCDYSINYSTTKTGHIMVGSTQYDFSYGSGQHSAGSVLVYSNSFTIGHDSYGNASVYIGAWYDISITYSGNWVGTLGIDTTAGLDALPKSAPGSPEWGPSVSPTSVLAGTSLNISWGGGGGFGMSGGWGASFSYSQIGISTNGGGYGNFTNVSGFSTTWSMPNIPGGYCSFAVRIVNDWGLAGPWVYSGQVQCLGATTINSVTDTAIDTSSVLIPINTNVYVSSYYHNIYLIDTGVTGTVLASWSAIQLSNGANTLALSAAQRTALLNHIPNSTSFSAYLYIDSYPSSANASAASFTTTTNRIGSRAQSASFNLTTSQAVSAPTVPAFTTIDSNAIITAITSGNSLNPICLVQNLSTLQVTVNTATSNNGSSISTYSVAMANAVASGTAAGTYNLGTISQSGTLTCILTVTDSREYKNTYSLPINVAAYSPISIITASSSCVRNGYGTQTTLNVLGSLSPVTVNSVNKNLFSTIKYRYLLNTPISLTVSTMTSGSTVLVVNSTSSVCAGEYISGTGIPSGTYISSITNSTTLVLSQAATVTRSSGSVTVGGDYSQWITDTIASTSSTSFILNDTALIGDALTSGFMAALSYTIQVAVIDTISAALGTSTTATFILSQSIPIVTFKNAMVGVNNPNPSCALDIVGNENISNSLTVGGTLTTGGINIGSVPVFGNVGQISYFPSTTAPAGHIACSGVLLSRTTYANLWTFANASGNIVTDSVWTAGGHDGSFSMGDGSTTFRIPFLNGYSVRSWDNGRGVDSGRGIGTSQQDQNKSHGHTATGSSGTVSNDHSHSGWTGGTDRSSGQAHAHNSLWKAFSSSPSSSGWIFLRRNAGGDGYDGINEGALATNTDHLHYITTGGISANHTHAITVSVSSSDNSGTEVRVKNIALLACIKY